MSLADGFEVGGDFDANWSYAGATSGWPNEKTWVARGRDAFHLVLGTLANRKIHLPDYYCEEVTASLSEAGFAIERYAAAVVGDMEDVDSFRGVAPGDLVALVNYFGMQDKRDLTRHLIQDRQALVLEDHTHDPLSTWALASTADYCMASLRKSMPVPDGAILWSPARHTLSEVKPSNNAQLDGLTAMAAKQAYLRGGETDAALKNLFRALQAAHHQSLDRQPPIAPISAWSLALLRAGYPVAWRETRRSNHAALLEGLAGPVLRHVVYPEPSDDKTPFGCVLLLEKNAQRDELRHALIKRRIYAPVHWPIEASTPLAAKSLAERLLTIPTDHRYATAAMARVAMALNQLMASSK